MKTQTYEERFEELEKIIIENKNSECFNAGMDKAKRGAFITNSNYNFFITEERKDSWEKGVKIIEQLKELKEEIKAKIGCGKYFEKEDRTCGHSYGYHEGEVRDYIKIKTHFDKWLCPDCQGLQELIKKIDEVLK